MNEILKIVLIMFEVQKGMIMFKTSIHTQKFITFCTVNSNFGVLSFIVNNSSFWVYNTSLSPACISIWKVFPFQMRQIFSRAFAS